MSILNSLYTSTYDVGGRRRLRLGRRRVIVPGRVRGRDGKEALHHDATAFENGVHDRFLFLFDIGHNRHEMIHTQITFRMILQRMMDLTEIGHEDHFMQNKMGRIFRSRGQFFMMLLIH